MYGGFYDGEYILLGTVVIPETQSYISDEPIRKYEYMGYRNMLLDDNHIIGYQPIGLSDEMGL
ncbi:hypothetical protein [Oceanobacillus locisalsi]|uniref:YopX protein domain-containing protein n=1 Tax=Oceanobacillus locisalsi TaxID=546107 RepID=A0ABW3NGL5_9BACI